jgi:hypothetical protein
VPDYSLTDSAVLPFVLIPVLLVCLFMWGVAAAGRRLGEPAAVRRITIAISALIAIGWMALTWALAASGVFRRWDATPPPFALLVIAMVVLALRLSLGRFGARLATGLPLWTLVAVQSFRFPLETAMHALYEQGIMPAQMSYSGRNFDIITGITALVVAVIVRRRESRALVAIWNVMGFALLVNVVIVAILSTPRIAFFGPDRLSGFVAYPPFVWLPAVMVLAALAGHVLICRALIAKR